MEEAWAFLNRIAELIGWVLEQLMMIDRIMALASSMRNRTIHDLHLVVDAT